MIPVIIAIGALFWAGCKGNGEEESMPDVSKPRSPEPREDVPVYNPTKDAYSSADAKDEASQPCTPNPCDTDIIEVNKEDPTKGTCIQFKKVSGSDYGLDELVEHRAIALTDFDGDGKTDIYLMNKNAPDQLFGQIKKGFQKIGWALGQVLSGTSQRAAFHDYDGDGDQDMILVGTEGSHLYKRENEIFVPVDKGIHNDEWGKTAAWIGSDVLLGTENGLKFYRHTGNDDFVDATEEVGLVDYGDPGVFAVNDYDQDGIPDVFVGHGPGPSRLYKGLPNGTYQSVEDELGLNVQNAVTDAQWIVWPGQVTPALYVSRYDYANKLFMMNPDGVFEDRAYSYKLDDDGFNTKAAWTNLAGKSWPSVFLGRWDQKGLLLEPQSGNPENTPYVNKAKTFGMDEVGPLVDAEWVDVNNDQKPDLITVMQSGAITVHENVSYEVKLCP